MTSILIVEDEGIVARDIQDSLEKLGYTVPAIAMSGKAAIESAAEVRPDMVLMDIVIKGSMDGIEAAQEIRDRYDIPVVFVTAYADRETLQRAKITEPCGYILKPFDETDLLTAIEIALYKHDMERQVRQSQERHRMLFETMAQGVVYQDRDGRIISANPAAERILGLTLDQMQGRTSIDPRWKAVHEDGSDFPGETHPAMVALRTGETVPNVVMGVFNPRREAYTWINVNAVPQFRPGEERPYQVYATFEDITQRTYAEQALIRASRMETAATLSGGIAHRVNNMMVGVLGYAELLKLDLTDRPDALEMLDTISRSAREASELALQMLTFAQGGKSRPREMDLNDIVAKAVQAKRRSLPPGIRVECHTDPELWPIKADAMRISEVILHLLTNATEAIEDEGLITLTTRNVEEDVPFLLAYPDLEAGPYVCLTVQDTGCGISDENQPRVFDPFFTTKFQGRGMGLAVVYGIVENHGGRITVHSDKECGATFTVFLPAIRAESEQE